MKVAICISGQPRNVHKGFVFIEPNLLAPNDCDVFIHMWWNEEQIGKPYINAGGHTVTEPLEDGMLEDIIEMYNPVLMHHEPQKEFDEKDYAERAYPAIKPASSLSQKYSSMKAHELRRKSGREYDAVVRLRFDFALQTLICVNNCDLNVINVPNRCPHTNGVDDTFAIGSPENMDVYGNLYNHIDDLYHSNVPFCDEILLGQHLSRNNISVKLHNIVYDLLRG